MLLEKTNLDDIPVDETTWVSTKALLNNPRVSYSDGELEDGLLDDKYIECSLEFIESMINEGQKAPVLITKSPGNHYFVRNGHHRLAVADFESLPVLVLIVDFDDDRFIEHWYSSESEDYPESIL